MGIRALFNDVKSQVQAWNPEVEFLLTAEAIQFHGAPPKIVWELPLLGNEVFTRRNLGPGVSPERQQLGRALWTREVTCNVHIWMSSGGTDSDGYEYPDDNEDPAEGTTWLVQRFIQALHRKAAGQYELGAGGWVDRSMTQLGFAYVLPIKFLLGVFDTELPEAIATIETVSITGGYTS